MYGTMYGLPPPTYFSIDVECVAVGIDHNARAVGQIALVDEYERCLLNVFVKPQQRVTSYLTPLTGLTAAKLEREGVPLRDALAALRRALPAHAVLVGQNIGKDVEWLALKEGTDFASMVDLSGLYRVWNPQYKTYSVFSQDHLARVLLGWESGAAAHDAALDATKSMRLWRLQQYYAQRPGDWEKAKEALLATPPAPSFAKSNPSFEGVCMGNRRTCTCGAPFFG